MTEMRFAFFQSVSLTGQPAAAAPNGQAQYLWIHAVERLLLRWS
jgi:hypothetical protein